MHGRIIHPTDFSDLSHNAFAHALKIALTTRAKLYIAHIGGDDAAWSSFPHIRQTLARWRLIDADVPTAAIFDSLGVEIAKVEIAAHDPVRGLSRFVATHPSELMVLATHGRDGLPRWLAPSVAEAMARQGRMQTLFISGNGKGFVDPQSGTLRLQRVLLPVDHNPPPAAAVDIVRRFCLALGAPAEIRLLHIGAKVPALGAASQEAGPPIELRTGNVVDGILQAAADLEADLIAMPTAGHHGLLDTIRGSTTERVLRHAPCPLLAIPVAAGAASAVR